MLAFPASQPPNADQYSAINASVGKQVDLRRLRVMTAVEQKVVVKVRYMDMPSK